MIHAAVLAAIWLGLYCPALYSQRSVSDIWARASGVRHLSPSLLAYWP